MALTREQQIERFGVTTTQAHRIRNRADKALDDKAKSAARAAWQDLSYELRGNKGQPFQCPRHPEAVRFHMLSALAAGKPLDEAVNAARGFAWSEPEA